MNILPYRKLTFHAHKTAAAVALLLLRAIPPEASWSSFDRRMEFEYFGSVWEHSFMLDPNINFGNKHYPIFARWNPFIPVYKGKLIEATEGTLIEIKVSPRLETVVLAIFLLFLAVSLIVISIFTGDFSTGCPVTMLLGILIIGWILNNDVSDENQRLADFLHRIVLANLTN